MDGIKKKCVMVLDEELPVGLAVNAASVLAVTLGRRVESIVGPDIIDGSGQAHAGIVNIPIPILKADASAIKDIRLRAAGMERLLIAGFTDVAQTSKTYDEYTRKISRVPSEELGYLGIALYGDKKLVNKLTGSLPLLR